MTPEAATAQTPQGSIRRDGEFAVIRLPLSEVHALRVALNPCPCRAAKSTGTLSIRQRIEVGLARLVAGKRHEGDR